jgi:hypothetical protein
MATIYNFEEELAAIDTVAIGDIFLGHDASSGVKKQFTVSQLRVRTVTASTNFTATGSTSSFFAPNEGIANIQATSSGMMFVTPSSMPGQVLHIWAATTNIGTTGFKQICVGSSTGSGSPSFDGTNCIMNINSSASWGVTLVSLTTAKWGVVGAFLPGNQSTAGSGVNAAFTTS